MTNVKRAMGIAARASLFLLIQFLPLAVHGQVLVPSISPGENLATFGNFAYRSPGIGTQSIYGYTIGGYLQTSHLFGLELRGSALPYGGFDRQYSALGGPRVAYHFSRFTPYVAVLGGVGHAEWLVDPEPHLAKSGIGAEWDVVGGVDWYLGRHISVRAGEISYSKIYLLQGISPITYSTGIVIRLPRMSRVPFVH